MDDFKGILKLNTSREVRSRKQFGTYNAYQDLSYV